MIQAVLDGRGSRAGQDPPHSHEFGDTGILLVRVGPLRDAANVALLQRETEDPGLTGALFSTDAPDKADIMSSGILYRP